MYVFLMYVYKNSENQHAQNRFLTVYRIHIYILYHSTMNNASQILTSFSHPPFQLFRFFLSTCAGRALGTHCRQRLLVTGGRWGGLCPVLGIHLFRLPAAHAIQHTIEDLVGIRPGSKAKWFELLRNLNHVILASFIVIIVINHLRYSAPKIFMVLRNMDRV